MKDVMKKALDHPIASMFIISELSWGIARIIRAFKGDQASPGTITVSNTATE